MSLMTVQGNCQTIESDHLGERAEQLKKKTVDMEESVILMKQILNGNSIRKLVGWRRKAMAISTWTKSIDFRIVDKVCSLYKRPFDEFVVCVAQIEESEQFQ